LNHVARKGFEVESTVLALSVFVASECTSSSSDIAMKRYCVRSYQVISYSWHYPNRTCILTPLKSLASLSPYFEGR